jgi:hypothetical protein
MGAFSLTRSAAACRAVEYRSADEYPHALAKTVERAERRPLAQRRMSEVRCPGCRGAERTHRCLPWRLDDVSETPRGAACRARRTWPLAVQREHPALHRATAGQRRRHVAHSCRPCALRRCRGWLIERHSTNSPRAHRALWIFAGVGQLPRQRLVEESHGVYSLKELARSPFGRDIGITVSKSVVWMPRAERT